MAEASSDIGVVIPPGTYAVTWSEADGYRLFTPNMGKDATVPMPALALTGAFIRLDREPDFHTECLVPFTSKQ